MTKLAQSRPLIAELKKLLDMLNSMNLKDLSVEDRKEMENLSKDCIPRLQKLLKP